MHAREEAMERVARGKEYLEALFPGKLRGVDTSRMWLNSAQYCVLGMMFGSFAAGCEKLGFDREDCIRHGFIDTLGGGVLGEAWRVAIGELNGFSYPY